MGSAPLFFISASEDAYKDILAISRNASFSSP